MVAYLAILTAALPLMAFALFPPKTARWRSGRRLFWASSALALLSVGVNVAFVDPAGPAPLFYAAWLVFVVFLAGVCYGAAIVRGEWSEWRRIGRERAERVTDPSKPWLR